MMENKKQSYINKLRILKEKHGFTVEHIDCNDYKLDWHKWEDFGIHVSAQYLDLSVLSTIEKLFDTKVRCVFGSITDDKRGICLLLNSKNTYYKKAA